MTSRPPVPRSATPFAARQPAPHTLRHSITTMIRLVLTGGTATLAAALASTPFTTPTARRIACVVTGVTVAAVAGALTAHRSHTR